MWNPWHGCHKISPGCAHCYVYRRDESVGLDSSLVHKTSAFGLPLQVKRDGSYKLPPRSLVWTCFTSDFLVEEADPWREEAWQMMRQRSDCRFFFITKRPARLAECLPADWGAGYPNVMISCTVEDQQRAEERIPVFRQIPAAWKGLACEPLLGPLELMPYLGPWLNQIAAGGESGPGARTCDYEWIVALREQCVRAGVAFSYHQTGARLRKDGRVYYIPRRLQHSQSAKAGIDWSLKGAHITAEDAFFTQQTLFEGEEEQEKELYE